MRSDCPKCGFELWIPLGELRGSTMGLYDDARFPGRCILMFHDHVEALDELKTDALEEWVADLKLAMMVVRRVAGAQRVNVAILGNAEPHLHVHLIPRIHGADPVPNASPWDHPRPVEPMPPATLKRLVAHLQRELASEISLNVPSR